MEYPKMRHKAQHMKSQVVQKNTEHKITIAIVIFFLTYLSLDYVVQFILSCVRAVLESHSRLTSPPSSFLIVLFFYELLKGQKHKD